MCSTPYTLMGLILYTAYHQLMIICLLPALPDCTVRSLKTVPFSLPCTWPGRRKTRTKYLLTE